MRAGLRFDELSGDADAVARLAHAAFEHIAYAELAPDALDVDGLALVDEARIARDHEQPADAREAGDDILDHAVGEILLFGIAAEILEGQHGDRGPLRQGERRALLSGGHRGGRLAHFLAHWGDEAQPLFR